MDSELILKNHLKQARLEKKLSQGELARLAGVSRQTICSIETGVFNPTAKLALILCIALDKKTVNQNQTDPAAIPFSTGSSLEIRSSSAPSAVSYWQNTALSLHCS